MSSDMKKFEFILEKIEDIELFISKFDNIYLLINDKMGFDATLNKLENNYNSLKDKDIKGAYDVRNFIAHDYEGINKSIIENILRYHIPSLKNTILKVINSVDKKQ